MGKTATKKELTIDQAMKWLETNRKILNLKHFGDEIGCTKLCAILTKVTDKNGYTAKFAPKHLPGLQKAIKRLSEIPK